MRRTMLLIFIIFTIAFLFLLLALAIRKNSGGGGPIGSPSTIPYTSTSPNRLSVVSTRPQNKASNVPVNQVIVVTFNRTVLANEVAMTIAPQVPFSTSIQDNTLVLTPQAPLVPGTLYTYAIHYLTLDQLPNLFTFTTAGPTQAQLPDTGLPGGAERKDADLLQNRPDIYLRNRIPYSDTNFTITSMYKTIPTGHFAFTVSLSGNDKEAAKREAVEWMKSLGLTQQQIGRLDISYEEQQP